MKRVLVIIVVIAALIGGGYWFMQNRERFFPKPEAKKVAPQRWQVSATGPPEPLNATPTTDAANASGADEAAGNATAEANATETVPPADEIVRRDFVSDACDYLVARYLPGNSPKNPAGKGRFDLNVKSVNMRYGIDFPGLNVDSVDILGARQSIFRHVLKEPVLESLYRTYTPLFLDSLDATLREAGHNDAQRSEMLTLLATRLRAIGRTVAGLAATGDVGPLVEKYLADIESVSQAHLAFWNVQAENASATARDEASARIKTTIQTREISRQRLLQAIVKTTNPKGMDASELIYLAQWMHRRQMENPQWRDASGTAGRLLVKVADAVEERSRQPWTAPETDEAAGEKPAAG
jgi:hypothetical protein